MRGTSKRPHLISPHRGSPQFHARAAPDLCRPRSNNAHLPNRPIIICSCCITPVAPSGLERVAYRARISRASTTQPEKPNQRAVLPSNRPQRAAVAAQSITRGPPQKPQRSASMKKTPLDSFSVVRPSASLKPTYCRARQRRADGRRGGTAQTQTPPNLSNDSFDRRTSSYPKKSTTPSRWPLTSSQCAHVPPIGRPRPVVCIAWAFASPPPPKSPLKSSDR